MVQTLHQGSVQRKLLGLIERSKKFDRMYAMDGLEQTFSRLGFGAIEFLKQYHPFGTVKCSCESGGLTDLFCTSFAIKGTKIVE